MTSPFVEPKLMLFAQEGYAPADMLTEGLKSDVIDGIILSPRVERYKALEAKLAELLQVQPDCHIIFDPQLFLAQNPTTRERHFDEYPYYEDVAVHGLGSLVSPRATTQLVEHVLGFQSTLPLSYVVSPGVYVENLDSRICETALSLCKASCEYCESAPTPSSIHPLLLSICLSETALQDNRGFHQFLEILTSFRSARGFYLIVGHSLRKNEYSYSRSNMSMLMYMCRVLVINGFEVHLGYTSWPSLLFAAVGASSAACGWNGKTRSFSWSDLDPQTGGRRPRPRISCTSTLSSVLVHPTLELLTSLLGRDVLFGASPLDRPANYDPLRFQPSNTAYTLQHWDTLRILLDQVQQGKTARERLGLLKLLIDGALNSTKTYYNHTGLSVGDSLHLELWSRTIDDYIQYASSKGAELL
jgi:hypothetical protein